MASLFVVLSALHRDIASKDTGRGRRLEVARDLARASSMDLIRRQLELSSETQQPKAASAFSQIVLSVS